MVAEEVGFEPTEPCGSPVFKTGAIDHSATPPTQRGDAKRITLGGQSPPCRSSLGFPRSPLATHASPGESRRPRFMTILVAPDKFKGSITAIAAAEAIARGWQRACPQDRIDLAPIADGGEG